MAVLKVCMKAARTEERGPKTIQNEKNIANILKKCYLRRMIPIGQIRCCEVQARSMAYVARTDHSLIQTTYQIQSSE